MSFWILTKSYKKLCLKRVEVKRFIGLQPIVLECIWFNTMMIIRMMRLMFILLSLFGPQRPNPIHAMLLSRFARIVMRRWGLHLIYLSVIRYLMLSCRIRWLEYHTPYRRLRSWNGVLIASTIIHFLMLLTIAMFFDDRYNWPLMTDDWILLRCKLINSPSW